MEQQLLLSGNRTENSQRWWRKVWQTVGLFVFICLWLAWRVQVVQAESPRFETFVTLPNSSEASAVVLGDFNGDGLLDLVVGARQNHLYLNQGAGLFTVDLPFGTGEATTGMATGDFNNDGALDLAVTTTGTDAIYLNQGNPNGTTGIFTAAILLDQPAANAADQEVLVGDFNGDGALDLVISSRNAPTHLHLNRNDGTGALDAGLPLDGSGSLPVSSMAAGDLNGDGALDLVLGLLGGNNRIYFNQNNGSGAFASTFVFGDVSQTVAIVLADLNGDEHLDLVVGNNDQRSSNQNMIYLNDGLGQFPAGHISCAAPPPTTRCFSTLATGSLVAGDLNGDGALDLLLGDDQSHSLQPSRIQLYLNDGSGRVITDTVLTSSPFLTDLALGDLNADGLLDLVVGNDASLSQRYLNTASVAFAAGYALNDSEFIHNMAVGDLNGDSALDLIISPDFGFGQGQIYRGDGKGGFPAAITPFGALSATTEVAVADMNGDGTLDLVTSGGQAGLIYLNDGAGNFSTSAVDCLAPPNLVRCYSNASTNQIAVGDLDGNGALDLIVATEIPDNRYQPYRYLNQGDGTFTPGEALGTPDDTLALALGDLDNDGDLDLVVAYRGQSPALYRNNGLGGFTERMIFDNIDRVSNLALGDLNGDGALDLVVGIGNSQNKLYLNDGAGNFATDVAFGNIESAFSTVLGDLNGDGALDLVVGNGSAEGQIPMTFYLNDGTGRFAHGVSFGNRTGAISLTLGDFNGDGALDLVKSNFGLGSELYLNHTHLLRGQPANPTAITVQRPLVTDEANFYSAPEILSTRVISIPYTLTNNQAEPVGQIHAFYSLNGGGQWRPAIAASGTHTTNLSTNGATHIFYWDTFASGFFGQSDNVVVRLEARTAVQQKGVAGAFRYPSLTPYPHHYPYASATTFPFRVRGTQVRVVDSQNKPVSNALVYRLPQGGVTGAELMPSASQPLTTAGNGYLGGRGALALGDQLVALQPLRRGPNYTVYATSAAPTENGLALQPVTTPGVQTLQVSAAHPLVLFDLDVALEWDASNDGLFYEQLTKAIQRASAILYDVSDGQIALGEVRLHPARAEWLAADVVIYANNNLRPRASMGGVVDTAQDELYGLRGRLTNAYLPGQVRLGPIWDPFGQNYAELTQDWQRALAHELAHYLLYLPDNYLGVENGLLRITDCQGSVMTDAYNPGYSEFLTPSQWHTPNEPTHNPCLRTVAASLLTGRSDWETVIHFYPELHIPDPPLSGPALLPLNVTRVRLVAPSTPTSQPVTARNYDLRAESGSVTVLRQAQAYVLQSRGTPTITDDALLYLGSTGVGSDRILVRGALVGDKVCVIDSVSDPMRTGCTTVTPQSTSIQLFPAPGWRPDIQVTPITSTTFQITVTQAVNVGQLDVQLLPAYGPIANAAAIQSVSQPLTPVDATHYTTLITTAYPALEGFVRVYAAAAPEQQQAITQFFLAEPWGPNQGWNGNVNRAWGANTRSLEAPAASGDGKVTILNLTDLLADTGATVLQAMTDLPYLPAWLTPVGPGYRFAANNSLARTIMFQYNQRDVPPGYEQTLTLYYLPPGSTSWQRLVTGPLATGVDAADNLATAAMPAAGGGEGIYALMATVELPPLVPGWNPINYPVGAVQSLTNSLAALGDAFTTVYEYQPGMSLPWPVYDRTIDPAFAPLVNTLHTMSLGHNYLIYATQTITPYIGVVGDGQAQGVVAATTGVGLVEPPATFYGPVALQANFAITAGMTIKAKIGEVICGESQLQLWQGQLVYAIQVKADTGDGCGRPGQPVIFEINGNPWPIMAIWDNRQVNGNILGIKVYLPMTRR